MFEDYSWEDKHQADTLQGQLGDAVFGNHDHSDWP